MRYLVGIGDWCGFDDSIGLRIAEAVAHRGLDTEFRAIDLGGDLLDLAHYLEDGTERVLIVDAARMGREPGEWVFFRPDQVAGRKRSAGIAAHEADVLKVLELASALGKPLAAVTILGIEPAEIRPEPGLSRTLHERFEEYVEAALAFMTSSA